MNILVGAVVASSGTFVGGAEAVFVCALIIILALRELVVAAGIQYERLARCLLVAALPLVALFCAIMIDRFVGILEK